MIPTAFLGAVGISLFLFFETHCLVEDWVFRCTIRVYIEVADTLELEVGESRLLSCLFLYISLLDMK
jgi:hypothetical protein